MAELIPGLYERLLTVELRRLVSLLEADRAELSPAEAPEAHVAIADHLRRILERVFRAVPLVAQSK